MHFPAMKKLSFLVLFAMVYLSVAQMTSLSPDREEPIKISTIVPSTSSVKPNRGNKLTETFKKIVDEMKKVDTGIKGWSNLTADRCQKLPGQRTRRFRCTAYVPKEDNSKGWLMKLKIDINLKSGNVELYNVQKGDLEEGGKVEDKGLVPAATYDFWSKLRDQILGHTNVNCNIHLGKEPNNCDVSINLHN